MANLPSGYGSICIQSKTTDGSTVFVDSSSNSHSIIKNGDVFHSTDQSVFGESSIYFGSSESYLKFPYFNTIDFYIYLTSYSHYIFYANENNYLYVSSTGSLVCKGLDSRLNAPTHSILLNQWVHIYYGYIYYLDVIMPGIDYIDSIIVLGVNGTVNIATDRRLNHGNKADEWGNITEYGINVDTTPPEFLYFGKFNGYAEEIRCLSALSTTVNFTPFNLPYPAYPFYVSGYVRKKINYVSRIVRAYDRETGDLLGQTTASSDGYFLIILPRNDTMIQIICLDDDIEDTEYEALIYDDIFKVSMVNPGEIEDPDTAYINISVNSSYSDVITRQADLPISFEPVKHIIHLEYASEDDVVDMVFIDGNNAYKLSNIEISYDGVIFEEFESITEVWETMNGYIQEEKYICVGSDSNYPLRIQHNDPLVELKPSDIRFTLERILNIDIRCQIAIGSSSIYPELSIDPSQETTQYIFDLVSGINNYRFYQIYLNGKCEFKLLGIEISYNNGSFVSTGDLTSTWNITDVGVIQDNYFLSTNAENLYPGLYTHAIHINRDASIEQSPARLRLTIAKI